MFVLLIYRVRVIGQHWRLHSWTQVLAELDDDALSDGGEGEITPEQSGLHETQMLESVRAEYIQAQMNDGLEQVRLIIGGEDVSELSDNSIKDALWEYYFDVEKTVQWSLGSWYLNVETRPSNLNIRGTRKAQPCERAQRWAFSS